MDRKRQLVIGVVGEVCAGKSAVAQAFQKLGAQVFAADAIVHEIYRRPEVIAQVKEMFGKGVIDAAGQVDRKALAKIVFADPLCLKALTDGIVFPRTGKLLNDALRKFRASDAPALVLDAPTLFQSGRAELCDRILFVTAPLERRVSWARERGWERDDLLRRDARLSSKDLCARATVFENTGSREELERKAGELFAVWSRGTPVN